MGNSPDLNPLRKGIRIYEICFIFRENIKKKTLLEITKHSKMKNYAIGYG